MQTLGLSITLASKAQSMHESIIMCISMISKTHYSSSEGACIVVNDQLISGGFPQQLYNPQCFLQYEEPTLPTQRWNVSDQL